MPTPIESAGVSVDAVELTRTTRDGNTILQRVSVSIQPGELVAIVGGSGAGKTTLLEALAGIAAPDGGRVLYDGHDLYGNLDAFRGKLGYVPQDDIIHMDLSLERTLAYAARLRLAGMIDSREIQARVADSLQTLDLAARRSTTVRALSGGQRKRASIAAELLTRPQVFFLDEPTSGLDPATSAGLLRVLRRLTTGGATVVFTTHAIQDLKDCDRVIFLAPGGRLAFFGTVDEALQAFGVAAVEDVYEVLARWDERDGRPPQRMPAEPGPAHAIPGRRPTPGALTQWRVLTARTFETLARNKLTLAILLGSPAMIVALFAILFRPGAFDFDDPQPSTILMILFWITFGSFFFGVTYGLLQIVTERPILRRERLVGLKLGPYLLSKVTVLLPFLVIVNVLMLGVLRALDRLPPKDLATYASMGVTLTLGALAALTLGLLASAGVRDASQATLALPMVCFPAVLFSGAILPVHVMAGAGAAIATVVPVRWAFEAVGHDLGIRHLLLRGGSPLGPPLVATFGDAGLHPTTTYWIYLTIFCAVFFAGAWAVLARTAERGTR